MIGKGYGGQVFGYDVDKVVKVINTKKVGKQDIAHEFQVGTKAGKVGIGPCVYGLSHDDTSGYIIMEKVHPLHLLQKDKDDLISLFKKAIQHKIVNLDPEFARTADGRLVMYDYGVASLVKKTEEAKEMYQDYLYQFKRMMGVDGVYQHIFRK